MSGTWEGVFAPLDVDLALAAKQEEAVAYMLRPESDGAALLAFDMGLGKTRTGLMFARESGASCVLVVAPLQTLDGWEETAGREYPDLPVRTISSSARGKEALAGFQWREPGIYLVTHQYWERLAWTETLVAKKRKSDPDQFRKVHSGVWGGDGFLLIFDEAHRTANPTSWTHKALMNLHPNVFKLSMSGTFMGNKFDGAYGATRWLWPHRTDIIPKDIFAWRRIWAETKYDRFAPRNEKVVGELEEGAFVSSLPCYLREEADLPEAITHELRVELYPEQRRIYDELDDTMVAWIEDNPLTAEYSITKRARQRQTTLAVPTLEFDDEDELVSVDFTDDAESVKIDRLLEEIDGVGELGDLMVGQTALILTDSQKFAKILTHRLNQKLGEDTAREWSGKVSRTKRAEVKSDFIEGKIRFIVGVQSAMGTGTDGLQVASHIVVFMSRADARIDNEQGIARLRRKGQNEQVHVVSFIAEDTVDTGQLSKQMEDAIKAAKSMRAEVRRQEREMEYERRVQQDSGF